MLVSLSSVAHLPKAPRLISGDLKLTLKLTSWDERAVRLMSKLYFFDAE